MCIYKHGWRLHTSQNGAFTSRHPGPCAIFCSYGQSLVLSWSSHYWLIRNLEAGERSHFSSVQNHLPSRSTGRWDLVPWWMIGAMNNNWLGFTRQRVINRYYSLLLSLLPPIFGMVFLFDLLAYHPLEYQSVTWFAMTWFPSRVLPNKTEATSQFEWLLFGFCFQDSSI